MLPGTHAEGKHLVSWLVDAPLGSTKVSLSSQEKPETAQTSSNCPQDPFPPNCSAESKQRVAAAQYRLPSPQERHLLYCNHCNQHWHGAWSPANSTRTFKTLLCKGDVHLATKRFSGPSAEQQNQSHLPPVGQGCDICATPRFAVLTKICRSRNTVDPWLRSQSLGSN